MGGLSVGNRRSLQIIFVPKGSTLLCPSFLSGGEFSDGLNKGGLLFLCRRTRPGSYSKSPSTTRLGEGEEVGIRSVGSVQ